ncbi:MAG: sodium:solute symporter [Saprospiraceae bacterium]|nr:sodium:solute symporter [Saprospiraceae bacterium]
MALIDWIIMTVTMFSIIGYGIWKTRGSQDMQSYLLGGNEAKWYTIGLSVMATQASAITFLSTPGQAYHDGMQFLQFYLMLPIALIIICVTFIPIFYKLKVYTAYEYLESRFDVKMRSLTSFLFLLQRGLAAGITIYAPAIIISSVMGWNLNLTTLFIGIIAILYTVSGGTKAVHVTHKLQMIVILTSMFIIFGLLVAYMPDEYSFTEGLAVANTTDKLDILDFNFDWKDRYNVWSSLAAVFLFLSYFGTDQSQVQRYISGKSIKESRLGLLFNAMFKVPLQFFILMLGIMVFIFYQFNKAPIFFNEKILDKVEQSEYADDLKVIQDQYDLNFSERNTLNQTYISLLREDNVAEANSVKSQIAGLLDDEKQLRVEAKEVIKQVDSRAEVNDKDYVFINFILNYLPKGLVGLLLAVVFFAAMSSTASELNALASTTTVDIYKRLWKKNGNDRHYLNASKGWTAFWGMVAVLFATFGTLFDNLIQFVNIVGSIFYGTILGIFLVAFYMKWIKANAVFVAAIITQLGILAIFYFMIYRPEEEMLSYLWLNIIGALAVMIISGVLGMFIKGKEVVTE